MSKSHLDYLDLAKGIGIILVIMGHTIFPVHQAISLFHMPLFFFLSGMTLKVYDSFEGFLIKKTDRIIVPYLFFSLVSYIVARIIGYEGNIFNGPLWFLQSLFMALVICELVLKTANHKRGGVIVMVVFALYGQITLWLRHPVFPFDMDFDRIIRSSVFVFAGYYMKDFIVNPSFRKKPIHDFPLFCIIILLYLVLCYISVYVMGADGNFESGVICKHSFVLFYTASVSGTLAVIFCSKWLKSIRPLNWLGRNSLIIMCVHYPFLQWWNPMVASWDFYSNGNLLHKLLVALLSYTVAIAFSCPFVVISQKLLPRLTGYKPLLSKTK